MTAAAAGTIYGIGVGPGDPGLLTMRAVEVLQHVSAVLAPTSRGDAESLALTIARPHLPVSCEVITATFPMTEERAVLEQSWRDAAATLIARVDAGTDVAFLTLGDAMLYSTWSYLMAAVLEQRPEQKIVTIPGITAMAACAAAAGRPLAEGRDPLLVWPDALPDDPAALLAVAPNIVFMKASPNLAELADLAESAGAAAVAVRRVSQAEADSTEDLRSWAGQREYFTTVLMHLKEHS